MCVEILVLVKSVFKKRTDILHKTNIVSPVLQKYRGGAIREWYSTAKISAQKVQPVRGKLGYTKNRISLLTVIVLEGTWDK